MLFDIKKLVINQIKNFRVYLYEKNFLIEQIVMSNFKYILNDGWEMLEGVILNSEVMWVFCLVV